MLFLSSHLALRHVRYADVLRMVGRAAAFAGAAEELDVTVLEAGPQLAAAERAAAELVSKASPPTA